MNTEPDNDGLEDVFPFPRVYSQVQNVNLPGCIVLEDYRHELGLTQNRW